MQQGGIFSDIVFEGNQRPLVNTLDQFRNGTSLCHSSCTTSTQRLACNISSKIVMKMFNEPGMQGNGPIHFKPKHGWKWKSASHDLMYCSMINCQAHWKFFEQQLYFLQGWCRLCV